MGVLDRDHPEPLYRRLMADLFEQISSGQFQPGQKLPSIRQLERIYGVSSIVVRRALGELQRQGQILSVPGRGTFVAQRTVDKRLHALSGFTEDMRRQGITASSIVLRAELVPAQGGLAETLSVPTGTEVALLERVQRNLERYRASVLKAAVAGACAPWRCGTHVRANLPFDPFPLSRHTASRLSHDLPL